MTLRPHAYGDALVVATGGRLDHESCEAFLAELKPHLESALGAGQGIVFDLSGLDYVSSGGLRCFMLASNEARSRGGKIVVAAPKPVVAEIFKISRFNLLFDVHPTLRQALASHSSQAVAAFDAR